MVKKDLTKIFIDEIYITPPGKNYPTDKTIIKSSDYIRSSDSLDMNDYGPKNNRGYRYIIVVIDKFSNFGWCTFEEQICSINNGCIFRKYQNIES